MRVEHYIEELLYRYNCVVVPEFGAFLANTSSARLNTVTKTLYPPSKVISFNEQLSKNDGLLVAHIAKSKKLGYEDILEEVVALSTEWKERLINGAKLELNNIGKLSMTEENRIRFIPEEKMNFLTASFGLTPFAAAPVVRKAKNEEVGIDEQIPFVITPEEREIPSLRPVLKYAAIAFLTFSLGATAYQFHNQWQKNNMLLVEQESQEQISKQIEEATFFGDAPLELPPINLNLSQKAQGPKYHVVAGAFRIEDNAMNKVSQLVAAGYDAGYIGENRFGLHQVSYGTFSDRSEALVFLRKIKAEVSPDAWMLSEN